MPSVAQLSRPSERTSRIIADITSMSRFLGERQAAPMQKRVAPASRAALARAATSATAISVSRSRPVSWRMLCGQYAQSSGQAPVFTDNSVLICTVFAGW